MAERRSRSVVIAGGPALMVAALMATALVGPGAALAAPRPGESCPDSTAAATRDPTSTETICGEGKGPTTDPGGSGPDLSGLLPFVAAGVGGAVIALGAAFFVLRGRAAAPAGPADPGEWWTCRNCGRNNVLGSPRCYACGQWQG